MIPALIVEIILYIVLGLDALLDFALPAPVWSWILANVVPFVDGWVGVLTRVIPLPARAVFAAQASTVVTLLAIEIGLRIYLRVKGLVPGA